MDVTVDSPGRLERKVHVEVPEDRIASEVATRLQRLSRTARIDGFRPGKVPMKVIQRRYAEQIRQEVVGDVLKDSFSQALAQQKLRPAGTPTIDPLVADPGQGLRYTATFEVLPEVELSPLTDLALERRRCAVGDADVAAMVEKLRQRNRHFHAVERPAQHGDRVRMDFEGRGEAGPIPGARAEDYAIEIGAGELIEGFESGLTGVKAGERVELNLKFPDDYRDRALAGQPVVFDVTVNVVEEGRLPDITPEFMQQFGITDGDEARFREEIRSNLEREAEQVLQRQFREHVLDRLVEANPVELPRVLVDAESARLLQEFEYSRRAMLMRGMAEEDLGAADRTKVEAQARRRVLLGLLLGETVKRAGLTVNPNSVRSAVERIAAGYENPAQVVRWYYEDPERLTEIEASCLEEDAIQWVASQAKLTEQNVAFDVLMQEGA